MPLIYAQKLKGLLEDQGRTLEIFTTKESVEKHKEFFQAQGPTPYPTSSGGVDSAYVVVKNEDLLIIKAELEKMGFPLIVRDNDQGDFRPEYLCKKCDYKSDHSGICPKHQVQLLEYSDWVAEKSKPNKITNWILIILVLAAVAFIFYTQAGTKYPSVNHFNLLNLENSDDKNE